MGVVVVALVGAFDLLDAVPVAPEPIARDGAGTDFAAADERVGVVVLVDVDARVDDDVDADADVDVEADELVDAACAAVARGGVAIGRFGLRTSSTAIFALSACDSTAAAAMSLFPKRVSSPSSTMMSLRKPKRRSVFCRCNCVTFGRSESGNACAIRKSTALSGAA